MVVIMVALTWLNDAAIVEVDNLIFVHLYVLEAYRLSHRRFRNAGGHFSVAACRELSL